MTTHCGKLFHLAGTAHRKCGARIDGSDRCFQCENCRTVDDVLSTLAPGSTAQMNDDGEIEITFAPVPVAVEINVPVEARHLFGTPSQDPNEKEVDQILARLESYYHGDEKLARGAKHLSVNTDDLRTLTDYIKYLRGQLRSPNRRG